MGAQPIQSHWPDSLAFNDPAQNQDPSNANGAVARIQGILHGLTKKGPESRRAAMALLFKKRRPRRSAWPRAQANAPSQGAQTISSQNVFVENFA